MGEPDHFAGTHFQVTDSPALAKPAQAGGPPIIIGGGGPRKTLRLAARFASEFNLPFVSRDFFVTQTDRVRAACAANDRDPAELTDSAALVVCATPAEARLRRPPPHLA